MLAEGCTSAFEADWCSFSWKTSSVTWVFSCIASKQSIVLQWEWPLSSFRHCMMSRGFCYWHLSCPPISRQDSLLCTATPVLGELSHPSHQHKGVWLLSPRHTWVCSWDLFKIFCSRVFFHFTVDRAGSKHACSSAGGSECMWMKVTACQGDIHTEKLNRTVYGLKHCLISSLFNLYCPP